ncbi:MAG TPA: tetratricopeptide repeat protein [Burkholderiales bacterium]|nr:tetratricopeptide repeat protein [Burkholderiales bacterium]
MKALEKAAKDRGDARQEAPVTANAGASAGKSELSLEPLATERPGATQSASAAQPQERPAGAARDHAQAATVLQAGARSQPSASGTLLRSPLLVLGVIAVLIAVAFAVYVALQILQPSPLGRPAPVAPKGPLPPLTQAPAPEPPAPVPPPLPAASVLAPEPAASTPSPAEPSAAPAPRAAPPRPAPAPAREQAAPERERIVVSRGSPEPAMNPLLPRAYAALEANRLAEARSLYGELLRAEPRNIDGLLGLAQIEVLEGNSEEATRHYFRILELDPRQPLAQSGLIALLGRADPIAAETRLKTLIAREPSAHLYFTLGNLYADQSMWPAAQHAYFQAYHLEPTNPNYTFNLAVGLEHVGQPKIALDFYRRAAQLAAARGHTHFNLATAQQRIGRLASQV